MDRHNKDKERLQDQWHIQLLHNFGEMFGAFESTNEVDVCAHLVVDLDLSLSYVVLIHGSSGS